MFVAIVHVEKKGRNGEYWHDLYCLNSETKSNWLSALSMNKEKIFRGIESVLLSCCYNVSRIGRLLVQFTSLILVTLANNTQTHRKTWYALYPKKVDQQSWQMLLLICNTFEIRRWKVSSQQKRWEEKSKKFNCNRTSKERRTMTSKLGTRKLTKWWRINVRWTE